MDFRRISKGVSKWNRKLHIYLSLYMLLFVWLFSFSGLIVNHPRWFPNSPNSSEFEKPIRSPTAPSAVGKAKELMEQLGIEGEIVLWPTPLKKGEFNFKVVRPSQLVFVRTDLENRVARVRVARANPMTVIERLHTFTGVRRVWSEKPHSERDWFLTKIWSVIIDAISMGIILLVVSASYMWLELSDKRRSGLIVLGLGLSSCAFFLWGPAWMPSTKALREVITAIISTTR